MMKFGNKTGNNHGFTIIETMIATTIFGVVLLVLAAGIVQITRTYYKGIVESNTQGTARSIVTDISQAIQFGAASGVSNTTPSPSPGATYYFCAASQRFTYQIGYEVKSGLTSPIGSPDYQTAHSLVVDYDPGCENPPLPPNLNGSLASTSTRDLIGPNMRLAVLSVTQPNAQQPDLFQVTVRVVYGDSDLLCSPNPPMSDPDVCNTNTIIPMTELSDPDLTCKGSAGSQFCAVSELSTTVETRLQ